MPPGGGRGGHTRRAGSRPRRESARCQRATVTPAVARACERGTVRKVNVETALGTYLEIADSVEPGLIEGLYVVGSYALDDWVEGASDIDLSLIHI